MTDNQTKALFLVIYAALMFGAYKFMWWFALLFPEEFWYFASPAIIGVCALGVIRYEWRKRRGGRAKGQIE